MLLAMLQCQPCSTLRLEIFAIEWWGFQVVDLSWRLLSSSKGKIPPSMPSFVYIHLELCEILLIDNLERLLLQGIYHTTPLRFHLLYM